MHTEDRDPATSPVLATGFNVSEIGQDGIESLSRPGLYAERKASIAETVWLPTGLLIMGAGATEALAAGAMLWPWYSSLAGGIVWLAGFALYRPIPFLLQKQRGGLTFFLINVLLVSFMACSLLFGLGRLGASVLR